MNRRAPLIAGIVIAVLAVAAVFVLILPKMGDVDEARQRLEEAEAREIGLQAELARLQEAAENAPEIRRELARFRRAVPPVADLPGIITQIQNIATVTGVDFFSVSPGDPAAVPAGGAAEVPASVQVIGQFFPVDEFLFRLENLPRASKVVNITVAEGPDGLPQIDVIVDVRFYTTDQDAGPGAAPPPPAEAEASPAPGTSPSPGASPPPAGVPATTPGA